MKKLTSLLLIAVLGFAPVAFTACSTAPSARVEAFNTLRIMGQTAKTGMDAATQLLKQGAITVEQWQKVADFYDHKFQPAYTLAVAAAQSDLTLASPELTNLAIQFVALVAALYPATTNPHP